MENPNMSNRPQSIDETKIETWFERDRAYVSLRTLDDDIIIEWWDDDVSEMVADGFLNPKNYHASAFKYAKSIGLVGDTI
jgi:hypothetical protein